MPNTGIVDIETQIQVITYPISKIAMILFISDREKNVDVKRSRELQGFLDANRRGQEQVR